MTSAIIFGVTGQDGSYLSELLLSKGYQVIGVKRRSSTNTEERLQECIGNSNFQIVDGDVADPSSVSGIISKYKADEVYNLAAMSFVHSSFEQPTLTFQVNAVGVLNILEAIRLYSDKSRFYQASSSEMFGSNYDKKFIINEQTGFRETRYCQDENTPLSPNSPYAVSKVTAHHLVNLYRRAYNLHASAGILLNHESSRRGEEFVTRKITKWVGRFEHWRHNGKLSNFDCRSAQDRIYCGVDSFLKLRLGNIDAKRDWGHSRSYVEAMYLMLQQEEPDDYVIASGKTYSVRDFLTVAFKQIGIENWSDFIVIDLKFYRPCEVEYLLGDASKAKKVLGWEPKITFEELVKEMVQYDIEHAKAS